MRRFSVGMMAKLGLMVALLGGAAGCEFRGSAGVRMPYVVVTEAPPPPPPQRVVMVARPGQIWIEGHQRWTGHAYVWQEGRYERERPGYVYAPGQWRRQNGGGHVWIEGTWKASGGHGNGRAQGRDHRKH